VRHKGVGGKRGMIGGERGRETKGQKRGQSEEEGEVTMGGGREEGTDERRREEGGNTR